MMTLWRDVVAAGLILIVFLLVTIACLLLDHWARRQAERKCPAAWRQIPAGLHRRWRAPRESAWRN